MNRSSARTVAERLFIGIPLAAFALALLAWLRYGVDLPFFDDWREYMFGDIDSLSLRYLFRPANDTLFPVGRLLDALAQRFLDGNAIAYQFISMAVVIGTLFWLQWKLLRAALPDRLLAACCFSFVIFTLQPGSYWGKQNLAYHQAIPILCFLGILYVTQISKLGRSAHIVLVFLLGLVAGLTYISGAFVALPAALALVVAYRIMAARRELIWSAAALVASGIVTGTAQAWVILVHQGGAIQRKGTPWGLPNEPEFWLYLLGKTARSLALPMSMPVLALAVTGLIVCGAAALTLWHLVQSFRGGTSTSGSANIVSTFLVLAAVTVSYLVMVAAGRTHLGAAQVDSYTAMFQFGFERFHFFWVTLIWPWAFALLVLWLRQIASTRTTRIASVTLAGTAVLYALVAGVADNPRYFREMNLARAEYGVACLQQHLQQGSTMDCRRLAPWPLDKALAYGVKINASFAKYFKYIHPATGTDRRSRLFDIKRAQEREIATRHFRPEYTDRIMDIAASKDPQIILRSTKLNDLSACATAEVSAGIFVAQADVAQVFFSPKGTLGFIELNSEKRRLKPGWNDIDFVLRSPGGFEPRLRLDPFTRPVAGRLDDLTIYCLK
jgi:hypothetical protein